MSRIVSKNETGAPVSEKSVVYLTDLSPKDKKWDYHRANTTVIGQHYDANVKFTRLGDRMAGCTTWLGFAELVNRESGEVGLKLRYANFCGVRHCPTCAWRRTLRNTARFFAAIPRLQEQFPKHRWLFLTLTVKNCEPENLRETIKAMNAAWQRLVQRKNWPGEGWLKAVEVTRGEDGSAHPHFHVMVMVKPSYFTHGYIKHEEWAERWKSVMRLDYTPVVDVRAVKPKKEGQTIEAAVVETLKYATKVQDSLKSPEWLYIITEQLHKMRFVESGGALKGVLKEQFTDEELIAGDEPASDDEDGLDKGEEKIVGVTWNGSSKRYIRSTQGSYSPPKTRKPKPLPDERLPKPPAAAPVSVAKSYTSQEFATATAAHVARVRSDAARSSGFASRLLDAKALPPEDVIAAIDIALRI